MVKVIFFPLLKDKQLNVSVDHQIPSIYELKGKNYYKWHNSTKALQQQIQSAIEQGRLIFRKRKMRINDNPFSINMVEISLTS
jgi:hypothetical protein